MPRAKVIRGYYSQLDSSLDSIGTNSAHYRIVLLVALGSLINVIEQYIAGYAAPVLKEIWNLSATDVSALSATTFLAMALGATFSGLCADRFGRRNVFMVNVGLYAIGSLLAALAPNFAILIAARIVIGFGLGGEIGLGYTVVTEMMATKVRATMTSGLALVSSGGGIFAASGLAALILGPLAGLLGGQTTAWRWLFAALFVPGILLLFFRRYIPESPRYLLRRGEVAQANRVLSHLACGRLRDGADIPQWEWVRQSVEYSDAVEDERSSLRELFTRGLRRRTLVAWTLTLALFGAIATFSIFLPALLAARGVPVSTSLFFATIANFAGLVGAAIGVPAAHFVPRRRVYVACGLVLLVVILGLSTMSAVPATLILAAATQLTLQIISPTSWCYLPELFPTRVRATGAGSASTVGMVAAGVGPLAAGALLDSYGLIAVFVLLSGLAVVLGVAALFGPETKGTTLSEFPEHEEIEETDSAAERGQHP